VNEFLGITLTWAVALSGYPMPESLPQLESKPHSFFVENVCKGRAPGCHVVAWYNDTGIIYFDESYSPFERDDIIVHEVVHYLQHLSGRFDSSKCEDRVMRELEAYRVQFLYIRTVKKQAVYQRPPPMVCPQAPPMVRPQ
jgi:hypothetical protein